MTAEKYIYIDGYFESVEAEARQEAINQGQVFICYMKDLNYKTLRFGVFDPSLNDTIQVIAVFRLKEDAITFINAQC